MMPYSLDCGQNVIYTLSMINENRIQTVCLIILTAIAIAASLHALRSLMIPFLLALFFTLMLTPITDFLVFRLKFPRALASFVTFLLGILFLGLFSLIASASLSQMMANASSYQAKIRQIIINSTAYIKIDQLGIDPKSIITPILQNLEKNIGNIIGRTLNAIVNTFSNIILVILFVLFLLVGNTVQSDRPKSAFKEKGTSKIKRYLGTKFVLSILLGISVGIVLRILGIKLAVVFGLFAGILNFIPTIGPVIATVLPLPAVLMTPEITLIRGILAIVLPGCMQFLYGNIAEPKVLGDSLDLHPVAVLLALIFWGILWGIAGLFLAIPITAVIKMLCEESDLTRPVADLLAGRLN